MSIKSRFARALGVGTLALTMAMSTTAVFAADPQSSDPSVGVQLPSTGKLDGALGPAPAGGWAGSANRFAYYKFKYTGNKRVVTINVQVWPDDETIVDQAGFVLYGPKTVSNPSFMYVVGGPQPKKYPNVSGDLISDDAGDYLIQVYNDSQTPINFTIWADNLPIQPALPAAAALPAAPVVVAPVPGPVVAAPAPAVAAPAPAPAPPAVPAPAAAPAASPTPADHNVNTKNSFTGDLAPGRFDIFQFDYPGDESVYTVNAQIYPDDGAILQSAGFQVFKPGVAGDLQVKGGPQTKLTPNVSANVISKTPGTYTVKVYNDFPNQVSINYTISLSIGKKENS